ncbi:hypothetical protein [Campylobacter sp. RM16192]|uniref:hypothetical protein n=1 Tax=Campylobacter sp. RM16192 TaxID=1660080 RepID=UPI00145241A3|nr:hypothetical protein [Campylobacter sp. RM16192]QCD52848.1 hypothetical protein CDOMC_1241 [Campylobacter sp. RM16192]
MKRYPRGLSYGEQTTLYKDSMVLKGGQWKTDYPRPKESARLPKRKAVVRTNSKLGLIWGSENLTLEEFIEQAKIQAKTAKGLCENIINSVSLTEAKEYAEQLKEVL